MFGTLRESSLHAALKGWYAQPGDLIETPLEGYIIDLRRGDQLIEIQTRHLNNLKPKLTALLPRYPVRVVYPIAAHKWIQRQSEDGEILSRRKSPARGRVEDMFKELVSLPEWFSHPHFSLEVALIEVEEIWLDDGKGSWRRKKWSIADRRLLSVQASRRFEHIPDLLALLPPELPTPFTARQLAESARLPAPIAGKMAYCLRKMGALTVAGKQGRAYLYRISDS